MTKLAAMTSEAERRMHEQNKVYQDLIAKHTDADGSQDTPRLMRAIEAQRDKWLQEEIDAGKLPTFEEDVKEMQECEGLGDIPSFMMVAGGHRHLAVVIDRVQELKRAGVLEKALIHGWTSHNTTHKGFQEGLLKMLWKLCDKKVVDGLRTMQVELPTTVYRGVYGVGRKRRIKDLSWTLDPNIAAWFATRFGKEDPRVFSTVVDAENFLFATDERNEKEVVMVPSKVTRMKWDKAELQAMGDEWKA